MRVNFLANVDFYSPVVNFIEKQSKIRLLVGAVVLGIFAGVALYRVFSRFWVNRDVQPQEQQVDPAVKKAAGEVLIGDKLPKPDLEVQEKKEPEENVDLQADVKPVVVQNQPIEEKIIKLDNERIHVYIERKTIMIMGDGPHSLPYSLSQQVIEEALQNFSENVYLDINTRMNNRILLYRDVATQIMERFDWLSIDSDDRNKAMAIMQDPTYTEISIRSYIPYRLKLK